MALLEIARFRDVGVLQDRIDEMHFIAGVFLKKHTGCT
jgi:hypothetical protein